MRTSPRTVLACLIGASAIASAASAQNAFTNSSPISIPSSGNAIPYPSTIGVSGITPPGNITNVVVTLQGLTHPRVSDLDIVLVGPGGQHCILRSDAGGDVATSATTVTFSRTGRVLTNIDAIPSGTFAPVNFGGTLEDFPGPGPGVVSNTNLGVYDGTSAVGTWSLFIIDDASGPGSTTGTLSGWTIRFNDPIADVAQSATEFSYQGILRKDGAPFSGIADLRFTLWSDASSTDPGAQFGFAIDRPGVPVAGGVFTTMLDFGSGAFSEKRRFLQVESRIAPESGFTPILPRTPITGVPFAGTVPLAKAATRLDAPDGSPTNVVEVDNSGFAKVNSSLIISGSVNLAGAITLVPTSRSRIFPACAWQPVVSTAAYTTSNGDWITGSTPGSTLTLFMPLNLPDGAIIREITLFFEDSATSTNVTLSLRKVQNNGSPQVFGGSAQNTGTPGNTSISITGLNEVVDSNLLAHTLNASFVVPTTLSQVRIGNVRVKYDITSPLP